MAHPNTSYGYQTLINRPIACIFCSATINGRVQERKDPKTKEIVKECHWICNRCGNVSKVGNLA